MLAGFFSREDRDQFRFSGFGGGPIRRLRCERVRARSGHSSKIGHRPFWRTVYNGREQVLYG